MNTPFRLITLAAAVATLTLAACSKTDDSRTAGQKVDAAVASAEQKTEAAKAEAQQATSEMKADAKQATAEMKADVKQGMADLKAGTTAAADKVASSANDAAITVSVNAELTKDPSLSALKINVDTVNGAVLLKGTAPTTTARERATQLAAGVKGVVRVDNQLEVRG